MRVLRRWPAPPSRGAWHLADCLLTYANGKTQRLWASSTSGYLIYSPNGHIYQSLNYPGRAGNIECISYSGHYEIVADRVFHSIAFSANIPDIDTVLKQTVMVENDRPVPSVSPTPAGGSGSTLQYVWNHAQGQKLPMASSPRALP